MLKMCVTSLCNLIVANATVVEHIIIIAILLATNCVVGLVNERNTIFQEAALTARYLQWIFLILCPLYQAAQVN